MHNQKSTYFFVSFEHSPTHALICDSGTLDISAVKEEESKQTKKERRVLPTSSHCRDRLSLSLQCETFLFWFYQSQTIVPVAENTFKHGRKDGFPVLSKEASSHRCSFTRCKQFGLSRAGCVRLAAVFQRRDLAERVPRKFYVL